MAVADFICVQKQQQASMFWAISWPGAVTACVFQLIGDL